MNVDTALCLLVVKRNRQRLAHITHRFVTTLKGDAKVDTKK